MVEAVVELEDVAAGYRGSEDVFAGLTWAIPAGALVVVSGPPGAGKTTLLRLLCLSLKPRRGAVRLFGQAVALMPGATLAGLRRRMGIVLDDAPVLDHLSVYENVVLPFRARGADEASFRAEAVELTGWLGVGSRLRDRPADLSTGERQLVAIARALVTGPDLILLDDSLASLAGPSARRVSHLLGELRRAGRTAIVTARDPALFDAEGVVHVGLGEGRLAAAVR